MSGSTRLASFVMIDLEPPRNVPPVALALEDDEFVPPRPGTPPGANTGR